MQQYLGLVRHILDTGTKKTDRTGPGQRALNFPRSRIDASNADGPALTVPMSYELKPELVSSGSLFE